jgi:trypsin
MAPKISLAAALAMQAAVSMAASIPAVGTKGSLIVGGEEATEGEFPSIVSLWTDLIDSHFCGGTLLNAHTVITAAHCADGMDPAGFKARAGTLVSGLDIPSPT